MTRRFSLGLGVLLVASLGMAGCVEEPPQPGEGPDTQGAARALTASDPAIQAGRLDMELHPWYGSAALQRVNAIHTRISEKNP